MLEVSDAIRIVLQYAAPLSPVERPATDADGLVLAADLASDIDSPPYTKALMDGYAVRSSDGAGPLHVIEEVQAGQVPTRVVGAGEATRIMTGAPIPAGADAVIPHEQTEQGDSSVRLKRTVVAGEFVLERGSEMQRGQTVVRRGTTITPTVRGLLAAIGIDRLSVFPAPRVAIISTGDELVEAPGTPGPGQIRNSNGPMLASQVRQAGAEATYLGIARDQRDELARLVTEGLRADVLILSGGVSAGKYDFVPEVLTAAGVQSHFHKLRMKPGRPLLFGTRGSTLVFGLPGNPASSFVGFELFVGPAIRQLAGHIAPGPNFVSVPLGTPMVADNNRPTYAPGRLRWASTGPVVDALPWFGSADLRGLTEANALLSLPSGAIDWPAGQIVSTLIIQ